MDSAVPDATPAPVPQAAKADLSSLGSMLQARWKSGAPAAEAKPESARSGQILKFRISRLDKESKKIELQLG
jgi:small subunit ribosomal protein S1